MGPRGAAAQNPQHAQSRDDLDTQPAARIAGAYQGRAGQWRDQGRDSRNLHAGGSLCRRTGGRRQCPHRARSVLGIGQGLKAQHMDIGFIGLGKMGFPMARRLIEAKHQLVVFDQRKEAVDKLVAMGAQAASSQKEVADRAETVLASLPSLQASLEVATGAGGVIEGKRAKRFVDLSTVGSHMAVRIHDLLAKRNIVQIDSPVSGGVGGAEKGTLAVMASGPRADFETVKPALEVIGKVFFIGEKPGSAQTMKLANNLLSATAVVATSEAVVMGVKAGLDPAVMIDVINAGSGLNTASRDKFPRSILPRSFDFGFATGLMVKDVRLCLEEAKSMGLSMEVAEAAGRRWEMVIREMCPASDFTPAIQPIEKAAGVVVGGTATHAAK